MGKISTRKAARERVARHRTKAAAVGSQRVEVTVPSGDVSLVKAIAGTLRSGGSPAEGVRAACLPLVSAKKAQTGAELVAFFRNSPLVGADLVFERDQSAGRLIDIE